MTREGESLPFFKVSAWAQFNRWMSAENEETGLNLAQQKPVRLPVYFEHTVTAEQTASV